MPTYGAERAVVLPTRQDIGQAGWRTVDNVQQQQRFAEEKKRYEQHRQDAMLEWAMNQMDFKHFATGTVLDPTIHQSLDGAMKGVTQKIMNGGYTNNAEMMYDVKNSVSDVANYSMKARNMRALIDENVKSLSKNPSIDSDKLRRLAYSNTFLKYDPNGNVIGVKSAQEIDDSSDPVNNVLTNSPEKVYTGPKALYESLPKQNFQEIKKTYRRRDSKGKYIDDSYSAKVYDHQEIYLDDNDNGLAKLRTKQSPVILSDGSQMNGLEGNTYERMFGTGDGKFILDSEYNKRFGGAQIDPEDKDKLKRALALHLIDASKVGKIENSDISLQKVPSSRTYNTINMPGSDVKVNDLYSKIDAIAEEKRQARKTHTQVNLLPIDAQQYVVDAANSIAQKGTKGENETAVPYTQRDLKVIKNDNGLGIYNAHTNKLIGFLDPTGTNLTVQPGVKEKRAVVNQGSQQKTQPKKETIKW